MKDKIKIIDNAVLKTKHKEYDKLSADHLEKEGNKLDKVVVKRRKDGTVQLFVSYYKKEEMPTVEDKN
jgi:hypothetical protein